MRLLLMTLAMLWGFACTLAAQQPAKKGRVSMQTALNDSTFFNVRLSFETGGEGVLKLETAYITKRGSLKRTPVDASGLHFEFFNNGFSERLAVSAEGITANGQPITTRP